MPTFLDALKTIGSIAGIVALVWRAWDEFGSHLRITVAAENQNGGWVTVLTTVDNKSNRAKDIAYAILLIGPESESPLTTARVLARACGYQGRLMFTNDLKDFLCKERVVHCDRALIPLTFYYSENIRIGDETLTYRVPIPVGDLQRGCAYAVRFFLFPERRLHRSTEDTVIVA
jgi:hypothetical protein